MCFWELSGQLRYVIFMKNKENHGEKQFYNEAFNISSSVSIYLVDVEWSDGVRRAVLGHDLQKNR